ncbi:hypothetical protein EJB05_51893, partial [Eragrostis curvula]
MNEIFSDDIIISILSRLPLKEVARARIVCKRWHALTSEHHFLCTSFSRSTGSSSIAGFFLSDKLYRKFRYVPLRRSIGDNHHVIPDLSFIPSTPAVDRGEIYVTSSCNGLLVCCRPIISTGRSKSNWFVCNPLTRNFVEIDVPDSIGHYLLLAYDPTKSRHYKIFAFDNYNINVYSSQTRSWRIAVHFDHCDYPFRGLRCYHSVFWNGSLVWVVRNHLVRLLVDDEQIVEIPMPRTPEGWICAYVGESGGHLQMIGFTEEERLTGFLDVLEMQDQGSSEWSVLYRLDLRRMIELYPSIRRTRPEFPYIGLRFSRGTGRKIEYLDLGPMYVVRGAEESGGNGLLLFNIPGKIMCYHTENHEFSIVYGEPGASESDAYRFRWYHFSPYSSSLFAP